ncbi:MAG: hypothetical protein LUQ31_07820 [Methanoregula sp.]|nr:hypothetical protein [Methanoregula sp.]
MKSLVIALGGTKAARLADILAYYSRRLDTRLYVEVFDTAGKALRNASVTVTRTENPPEKPGECLPDSPIYHSYRVDVSKDGYEPLSETVNVKPEQVTTAKVILVKEPGFFLMTAVFLSFLAPFIWAAYKYLGTLTGNPLADYLSIALVILVMQALGAFSGIKTIGARAEKIIHNRYYSGLVGLISGEVTGVLAGTAILGYLSGILSVIRSLLGGYIPDIGDMGIILVLLVILAFAGFLIDQFLLPHIDRKMFTINLFVAFGAFLGGLAAYFYLGRFGNLVSLVNPAAGGAGTLVLFPFLVPGFTLAWYYGIRYVLRKRGLEKTNNPLFGGIICLLGALLISILLPLMFGMASILVPFIEGCGGGALAGFLLYFLVFGPPQKTRVESLEEGDDLRKKYRLNTTSFVVDTVRSRLESLQFVPASCIHYVNDTKRKPEDFLTTDLRDQLKLKINGVYRENLESCSRLFSSLIVITDLRDNNLCAIYPSLLSFLRREFRIPVYAVVIATGDRLNRNWIKKVADNADAVFPVDYRFFDDVLYLDRFIYQDGGVLEKKDVYEEGCIVELVNRLCPLLEIGERLSPSGLDVSHINRLLSRTRPVVAGCSDLPDVVPIPNQNIATFGYFRLHTKKCRGFNLELGMGEYLEYALRHTLWKMERPGEIPVQALVIVRGKQELAKVGLVRTWLKDICNDQVVIIGDLLTESSDSLEIIILLSQILDPITEDSGSGSTCIDKKPEPAPSPGAFRKFWNNLVRSEKDGADERFRYGSPDAYTSIVKKYYNRSPLLRYRAVSLARQYPGSRNWEQAKVIYEWVRDNISYVCDPQESEYIQLPEETLNNGGGDCDDQAVLLASLLMCVGFRCSFVLLPSHIYVAAYIPEAPGEIRNLDNREWPDGTRARDWIGFDPTCTDCRFGQLPADDVKDIESIAIIG